MKDRENIFIEPAAVLLSSFLASHTSGFCSLLSKTSSSYPSPFREGQCCITNPNFITTISAISLYSTFSETPINIGVVEKRGLCLDGLLFWRRSGGGPLISF
jgi:hypothetical protein